ncbi:hypothetical protein NXY56_000449 [Leishmania guyanensis]|uniref:Uncharacterized protein n=1 Tax=Leishmania guyanensis TaxID=5670 RepID=A0A1E1INU9_LEIGU|nr:hypothetical protein, conserved [Leishmania guyanensis]
MEHSVSSRSPSGQWYPQQQQWSPASGTATPMVMMGGGQPATVPVSAGSAMVGNSGIFINSQANVGGQPRPSMTPQQQMMMMQSMYTPQSQCCAPCCGTQESSLCPQPGEPVNPFCCTPRRPDQEPKWWESVYRYFDWTFLLACVICVLTIVGFAMVIATRRQDNLFAVFDVHNTTALEKAIQPFIHWINVSVAPPIVSRGGSINNFAKGSFSGSLKAAERTRFIAAEHDIVAAAPLGPVKNPDLTKLSLAPKCTQRKLLGSFGVICMEDNLHANTLVVQLSYWSNSRDTLWILAMVYSILTVLYAVLTNVHRHSSSAGTGDPHGSPSTLPTITPQQQEEFVKMTPQQQQAFIQEFQQHVAVMQQQQQPNAAFLPHNSPKGGCCGTDSGIEFYETPFYEFVRMAWFASGITAFAWTCNLFISFWSFDQFYIRETTGPLRTFWVIYSRRMNATLIVVTVFLAWPLCNFVLELVMLVALVLPWLVIRSTCKRGIQMYRPALPLSKMPGYIRADMFFMDFQDVKRLGFSRMAWMMLTDTDKPFFEGCEDPTVDKDPAMTQLMQQRIQWSQMMVSMVPPWVQQQQQMGMMGVGGAGMMQLGQSTPWQRQLDVNAQTTLPGNTPLQSPAQYPVEDAEGRSHKRRRHRSTRDHRHGDPLAVTPMETSVGLAASGKENSTRHRHRRHSHSHSRSRSRSRSHSRSKGAFDGGIPQPPGTDAAVSNGAMVPADGVSRHHHHHHHRHSRSRSRAAGEDASAMAVAVPRGTGDAGHNGGASAAAELDALMQL